jgi:hypothetical protein
MVKPKYGANPTFSWFGRSGDPLHLLVQGERRTTVRSLAASRTCHEAKGGSGRGIPTGRASVALAGGATQSCGDQPLATQLIHDERRRNVLATLNKSYLRLTERTKVLREEGPGACRVHAHPGGDHRHHARRAAAAWGRCLEDPRQGQEQPVVSGRPIHLGRRKREC